MTIDEQVLREEIEGLREDYCGQLKFIIGLGKKDINPIDNDQEVVPLYKRIIELSLLLKLYNKHFGRYNEEFEEYVEKLKIGYESMFADTIKNYLGLRSMILSGEISI